MTSFLVIWFQSLVIVTLAISKLKLEAKVNELSSQVTQLKEDIATLEIDI